MQKAYPYRTISVPIGFSLSEPRVDGVKPEVDILATRGALDLTGLSGWGRVVLQAHVEVAEDELSRLGASDLEATVIAHSPATNLRTSRVLGTGRRPGTWEGKIEFVSGVFAEGVSVTAVVTGVVEGVPDRYLGASEGYRVWFDPYQLPPITGTLPMRWASFEKDDVPVDSAFWGEAFYVDINGEPPSVYLNEDVPGLRRLLDVRPRRAPSERALRTATFVALATSAWMGLFNASVASVTKSDEELADWPVLDWQRHVLRILLPRVYPDLADSAALAKLIEDDASPEGARTLQSRVQAAIAQQIKATAKFARGIRTLEGESNE